MKYLEMDLICIMTNIIFIYFIFNIISFFTYGIDKHKSIKRTWRVPEKTLLTMGAFGGLGQILGIKTFHHKTHKWYFIFSGYIFAFIQLVILCIIYTKFYI